MKLVNKIVRHSVGLYNEICKVIFNIAFRIKFLAPQGYGLNANNNRKERVVVSLTSFPDRMDTIHLCLRSLLCQKMKPDEIILYLSKEQFSDVSIPQKVLNLKKHGLKIVFCDDDIKPHKKYYYAMQQYPNDIIITVDDDVFYRRNLVRDLVCEHAKRKDEIICTRAHMIKFDEGKILPYKVWDYETDKIQSPSHYLLATGVGGVLYPARALPEVTFDKKRIKELCLLADDIWLKAMEIKSGRKVFAIPASKVTYVVGIWRSERVALNHANVGENRNDTYIRNVMSYFNISEQDFIR